MAEEQKWQEPEGHRLCANNCGFFGCPTTLGLCSKCYKDRCHIEQRQSTAKMAVEKSLSSGSSLTTIATSSSDRPILINDDIKSVVAAETVVAEVAVVQTNRCATCRKRVGLTGFRCRCGGTHCGAHRYPEEHACTFDFKAAGKEAIAKANPVVVAEKLNKI